MNWIDPSIDILVPDDVPLETALARTTHLAVGAHPDDLEVFAYEGISACYRDPNQWFTGITVTDGAGSVRGTAYAHYSDAELVAIRRDEQREAARIGLYGAQIQMGVPSKTIKDPKKAKAVGKNLGEILKLCQPRVVYLHNPLDRHPTHIAVFLQCLRALRGLNPDELPERCYGCETWRDLDWLPERHRISQDVSAYPNLGAALIALYDSQISSGKRYDLAVAGRRAAHATLSHSHAGDASPAVSLAVDLMPLLQDPELDPKQFSLDLINAFRDEVSELYDSFR